MNNFNGLKNNLSAYIDEKTFSEGKIQSVVSNGDVITIGIDLWAQVRKSVDGPPGM